MIHFELNSIHSVRHASRYIYISVEQAVLSPVNCHGGLCMDVFMGPFLLH